MYVGGTDSRKNLERLIDMFARAVAKGVKEDLVLIGHDFKQKDFNDTMLLLRHIEKSNIKSRIKIIGYVNDEELSTYYSQATAMVFPSNYEGFGMPVLEAMQASCPVICFNNSSIPEVAGDSALMVESEDQFIKAIIDISHKPKLREKLILSGKQRAGQFSWEKTAALTLSALERAAKP